MCHGRHVEGSYFCIGCMEKFISKSIMGASHQLLSDRSTCNGVFALNSGKYIKGYRDPPAKKCNSPGGDCYWLGWVDSIDAVEIYGYLRFLSPLNFFKSFEFEVVFHHFSYLSVNPRKIGQGGKS